MDRFSRLMEAAIDGYLDGAISGAREGVIRWAKSDSDIGRLFLRCWAGELDRLYNIQAERCSR